MNPLGQESKLNKGICCNPRVAANMDRVARAAEVCKVVIACCHDMKKEVQFENDKSLSIALKNQC